MLNEFEKVLENCMSPVNEIRSKAESMFLNL